MPSTERARVIREVQQLQQRQHTRTGIRRLSVLRPAARMLRQGRHFAALYNCSDGEIRNRLTLLLSAAAVATSPIREARQA